MGWPLRVSIKRINRILVFMGPVSLVPYRQQMLGFAPHCFNGWLRREIGYGPADRLAGVLWIMSGAFFLRSSDPA
jgi:hypothetical protein